MCIGCHGIQGYQASFPEVYKVPKISGQGEKYIANALTAYKKGERRHPTMKGVAYSLSDQDIADISAYYSTHGKVEGATLPDKATEAKPKWLHWLLKVLAPLAMVRTSPSLSTPAIPKLLAKMLTICMSL